MSIKNKILIILLFFTNFAFSNYTATDSLIEEAIFLYQIKGNPEKAIKIFEKIISQYPQDITSKKIAEKGIQNCRSLLGNKRLKPTKQSKNSQNISNNLLIWHKKFENSSIKNITISDSLIYVAISEDFLVCTDTKTNKIIWAKKGIKNSIKPVFNNGNIYCVNYRGQLTALNANTGKTIWISRVNHLVSNIEFDPKDRIYAVTQNNILVSVNKFNGKIIWLKKNIFNKSNIIINIHYHNGIIYASSFELGIKALKTPDGTLLWQNKMPHSIKPVFNKNKIYLTNNDYINALFSMNGKIIWNTSLNKKIISIAANQRSKISVVLESGEIKNINDKTGNINFSFIARPGLCINYEDNYFITDKKGKIHCYQNDGKYKWHYSTGETNQIKMQVLEDKLYICTENSGLFALNPNYNKDRKALNKNTLDKIDLFIDKGFLNKALKLINNYLNNVEPGNLNFLIRKAHIIENHGKTEEAYNIWQKIINLSDSEIIKKTNIVQKIKNLTRAEWSVYIENIGKFSPIYFQDQKMIVSAYGKLIILESQNGNKIWTYRLKSENMYYNNCYIKGDKLYFYNNNNLIKMDIKNQTSLWSKNVKFNITRICSDDKKLIIGTWNSGLYEISSHNSSVYMNAYNNIKAIFPFNYSHDFYIVGLEGLFSIYKERQIIFWKGLGSKISAMPIQKDNLLLISTSKGSISLFDLKHNKFVLEKPTGKNAVALINDHKNNRIYILYSDSDIEAIDLDTKNKIWTYRDSKCSIDDIYLHNNKIYFAKSNKIKYLNIENLSVKNKISTVGLISSFIIENDYIYISLENGIISKHKLE